MVLLPVCCGLSSFVFRRLDLLRPENTKNPLLLQKKSRLSWYFANLRKRNAPEHLLNPASVGNMLQLHPQDVTVYPQVSIIRTSFLGIQTGRTCTRLIKILTTGSRKSGRFTCWKNVVCWWNRVSHTSVDFFLQMHVLLKVSLSRKFQSQWSNTTVSENALLNMCRNTSFSYT